MELSKKQKIKVYKECIDIIKKRDVEGFKERYRPIYGTYSLCYMLLAVYFKQPLLEGDEVLGKNGLIPNPILASRQAFPEFEEWLKLNRIGTFQCIQSDSMRISCLVWCIKKLNTVSGSIPYGNNIHCNFCNDEIDVVGSCYTNVKLSLCNTCLREFHK